jgi:hypothetical protein
VWGGVWGGEGEGMIARGYGVGVSKGTRMADQGKHR